jgi:hypothetical protein
LRCGAKLKLFEECREQEEEEGKAGRFARKGKQHGQGRKAVAGGGCWVRATTDGVKFEFGRQSKRKGRPKNSGERGLKRTGIAAKIITGPLTAFAT